MRKFLLFCATLLTIFANGQTSVYHHFPDSNAVWNFNFILYCMYGTANQDYSIMISGDTLINSQTYHKLTTPFVQSFSTGTCDEILTGYKGAIRQDTTNRKVFYIPPNNLTEQLLYDFNMQVGDTVQGYIEGYAYEPDIVQSIDSVLVGNNYRKRWNINTCYNIHFIEGIGSTYGLIQQSPGCITDHADYSITCFQQNGQSLHPDTTSNCQLITSVNTFNPTSNQVKVFPNPSNGFFTVDFDQPLNITEIQVIDMLGNIVNRQKTNNKKTINIDNLLGGTYILTVFDKDNKIINRIIISSP